MAGAERVRSVTASPALPLFDIASRRAREAARPVIDEAFAGVLTTAVVIGLVCEVLATFPPVSAALPFVVKPVNTGINITPYTRPSRTTKAAPWLCV